MSTAGTLSNPPAIITPDTTAKFAKATAAARTIKAGDTENAWVATCLLRMAQIQAAYDEPACLETLRVLDNMLISLAGSETIPYVDAPDVFVSCAYLDAAAVAASIDRALAMSFIEKAGQANTVEGELGDMVRAEIACAKALAAREPTDAIASVQTMRLPSLPKFSKISREQADRIVRLYLGFLPEALPEAADGLPNLLDARALSYASRLSEHVAPEVTLSLARILLAKSDGSETSIQSTAGDGIRAAVRVNGEGTLALLDGLDDGKLKGELERFLVRTLAPRMHLSNQELAMKYDLAHDPVYYTASTDPHGYLAYLEAHPYEVPRMTGSFNDAMVALVRQGQTEDALDALRFLARPWHTQASIAQGLYSTEPERATALFEEAWRASLDEPRAVLSVVEKYSEVNPRRARTILGLLLDGIIEDLQQQYLEYKAEERDIEPLMKDRAVSSAYMVFPRFLNAYANLYPVQAVSKYKKLADTYIEGDYHSGEFLFKTSPYWHLLVPEDPAYFTRVHLAILESFPDDDRVVRALANVWVRVDERWARYFASSLDKSYDQATEFGKPVRSLGMVENLRLEGQIMEWRCVRALLEDPTDTRLLEEYTATSEYRDYSHLYYPPRIVMGFLARKDPEKAFMAACSVSGWEMRDHCLEKLGHDLRDNAWDDRIVPHLTDPGHIVSYYEYRACQPLVENEQFEAYRNYITY